MIRTVRISIILPTYNRAHIITNAVKSVLAQSISDWELLIIDDGSVDNTQAVIKTYLDRDGRIKYWFKENGGVSSARNCGMKMAKGEYIAFLDSDDTWTSEKLEKQLSVFNTDLEYGLVYTGIRFIDTHTGKDRLKYATEAGYVATEEVAYNLIGGPSRVMIKTRCITECGDFDEQFLALEDWDMWIRITQKFKVGVVADACVNYIEHSDSLTYDVEKNISGYKLLWQKHHILERGSWIQSIHYRRLGHKLCYGGSMIDGREYLLKAARARPFSIKNNGLYVLSFFPIKMYRKVTYVFMKYVL